MAGLKLVSARLILDTVHFNRIVVPLFVLLFFFCSLSINKSTHHTLLPSQSVWLRKRMRTNLECMKGTIRYCNSGVTTVKSKGITA